MPYSEKQKTAARIAKHDPGKLFQRNRNLLAMSKEELHKMATGPIKNKKERTPNLVRP